MMTRRPATSLIEMLVVFAIIAIMVGLSLPAFNAARQRALEIACKNNLRQISLGMSQYVETQKQLPPPGKPGLVGGWVIEVLPYVEQKNLRDNITPGGPISKAPDILRSQPRILICPARDGLDPTVPNAMDHSHYILVPTSKRKSFLMIDSPLDVKVPWASGPEMAIADVVRQTGPHNGGFFVAEGSYGSVSFNPGNQK